MIIFSKNIHDTYDKVLNFVQVKRLKRNESFINIRTEDDITINVLNTYDIMSLRGIRSNIILYDGEYTEDELFQMKSKLIDGTACVEKREPEVLFAPITWIKYVLSNDHIYCIQSELYGEVSIDFAGNNILKALNVARKTDRCEISCYKNNTDDMLWSNFIINKRYIDNFIKYFKG